MIKIQFNAVSIVIFSLAMLTCGETLAGQAAKTNLADGVRKTEPLSPEDERKTFILPPGFEAQLVASEPDISKPLNMAFDAAGRLWVNDTKEYPFPVKEGSPGRDSLKILSDFDQNGKARKIQTFADGLNIPIGVLPYGRGALGHSIPYIHYFEDTSVAPGSCAAQKADKRDVLYARFNFDRDTHGMTGNFVRGFDGWVYGTHGFNNVSTVKGRDGSEITMKSGNTYRIRPDGSRVEQYTWGQVNPFGMAFDELGNLFTADCHSRPMYHLLRGAHYPSFGSKDDGLGFGPEMMTHSHGSTAIGGIATYADDRFPAEFRNNIFAGNVMTSKVNRDQFVDAGTSRMAKEMPDFMSADDPWFRPVCLQLGPDGAMYVADFYNRIIGHYEVRLDHPGRDRERGRIWRIVYKGTPEKPIADKLPPDLSKKSVEELIAATGEANMPLRMLALWQIVDRIGARAVAPVSAALKNGTPHQKLCAMWVLFNLKALDEGMLSAMLTDGDRTVRTHAFKALSEHDKISDSQRAQTFAALKDADAFVRRAAADVLGRHPSVENVRPLIALRNATEAADTHLIHTARMSLRNQLLGKGTFEKMAGLKPALDWKEWEALANVSLGAQSEDAAGVLVRQLATANIQPATAAKYMEHAVKFLPAAQLDAFVVQARANFGNSDIRQLVLLKSMQEGTAKRGIAMSPAARTWTTELLTKIFTPKAGAKQEIKWTGLTLDGKPNPANPWVSETRAVQDNLPGIFLGSLPLGEKLTGVYRSQPFDIPAKLSFYLAGHNGNPTLKVEERNFVRLVDANSNEELIKVLPPRNDHAQKVTWDLAKFAGKKGVIELVDGDSAVAYAWLAAGLFEPAVVEISESGVNSAQRLLEALDLAAKLKLTEFETPAAAIWNDKQNSEMLRGAAATALIAINPVKHSAEFLKALKDPGESNVLKEVAAGALSAAESPQVRASLLEAMRGAPDKLQTKIAQALSARAESAEALLTAIAENKASPRVLFDKTVKDRLTQLKLKNSAERITKLTQGLQPADKQIQSLIDARVGKFKADAASVELGAKVFEKNCMACHQVDGKGVVIGPQLDGIGARGLERIAEDVLDPSRNVDNAFRVSLVKLNNGTVYSGLKRREEGEQVVFADSKGVESSIAKADIKEARETPLSLMPDGMSDAIPPEDFNNLMAFLLSKTEKK